MFEIILYVKKVKFKWSHSHTKSLVVALTTNIQGFAVGVVALGLLVGGGVGSL